NTVTDPRPTNIGLPRAAVRDAACVTRTTAARQMRWTPGDHGFALELSPELPATLAVDLRQDVESFLSRTQRRLADIRHWVIHPGGPKILDAVQAALGLHDAALQPSRDILRRYGNMSSTTVF